MPKPLAIYHEHPDWFRPLFAELDRRGIPYVRLDPRAHAYDPSETRSPYSLVFNRMSPSAYLRENLYITTSGVCSAPPLLCALLALGADHILFGADYPFEDMATATAFLGTAPISEADRAKISHANAERLLRLAPVE